MAVDLRSEIFQLRDAGVSQRGIARQLGITASKVQRELGKRSPQVRAERNELGLGEGPGAALGVDLGPPPSQQLAGDPLLAEQRRRLELERLELASLELQAKRLEAQRRMQLLEQPQGSGGAAAALTLQLLQGIREDIRGVLVHQPAPAAPPPPAPSLTEQLTNFRQMAETVNSFAPPKPPSSSTELEFTVARERLNLEAQDLAAKRELEQEERRERMRSEVARNDAVAKAIEQFAPVAATALNHYLEQQSAKPEAQLQLPAAPGDEDYVPPRPVVVVSNGNGHGPGPAEVTGACPNCGTQLGIAGDADEVCPRCKRTLVVMGGRIRVRLGNGDLYPPLQG